MQGPGEGEEELVFKGTEFHFGKMNKFQRQMVVMVVHNNMNVLTATELYLKKWLSW